MVGSALTPSCHLEAAGFLSPFACTWLFSAGYNHSFSEFSICAAADMEDPDRTLRSVSGVTASGHSVQGAAGQELPHIQDRTDGSVLQQIMTVTDQSLDEAQAKLVLLYWFTLRKECRSLKHSLTSTQAL